VRAPRLDHTTDNYIEDERGGRKFLSLLPITDNRETLAPNRERVRNSDSILYMIASDSELGQGEITSAEDTSNTSFNPRQTLKETYSNHKLRTNKVPALALTLLLL
jgi:hypothetical protein